MISCMYSLIAPGSWHMLAAVKGSVHACFLSCTHTQIATYLLGLCDSRYATDTAVCRQSFH